MRTSRLALVPHGRVFWRSRLSGRLRCACAIAKSAVVLADNQQGDILRQGLTLLRQGDRRGLALV